MKVNVAFHNVDHSDALVSFIQKKSLQVEKMLWNGEKLSWVIENNASNFSPKLMLKLKNKAIDVVAEDADAFQAVLKVVDKAKRLVKDDHKKLKDN